MKSNRSNPQLPSRAARASALVALAALTWLIAGLFAALQPPAANWTGNDIGTAGGPGSLTHDSGTGVTTLQSSASGAGGTADGLYFAHGPLAAGEAITAKLSAPPGGALGGEATGPLVRTGLATDSPSAFLSVKADGSVSLKWRAVSGGATATYALPQASATDWLRLVADETSVMAYRSADGVTWVPLMGVDLPLGETVHGGVALASGDTAETATAAYAEIARSVPGYRAEVTLDEDAATLTGAWTSRTAATGETLLNGDYLDDAGVPKGSGTVTFTPNIPLAGNYEVYARWSAGPDRETTVPIGVGHDSNQSEAVSIDQTTAGQIWVYLGRHDFASGSLTGQALTVSNAGTTGLVTIDAVKWIGNQWTDTDADGLPDSWELLHFSNLNTQNGTGDAEGDGLSNAGELFAGTDPNDSDSDGDLASDFWEVTHGYDPLDISDGLADTDADGLPNWIEESTPNLNPTDPTDALSDADGDRVPNLYEFTTGHDPGDPMDSPAPTAIVDPAQGGASSNDNIYATIGEAMAAIPSSGWPIIDVAPGTYLEKLDFTKRAAVLAQPGTAAPRIAGPGGDYPVYVRSAADGAVLSGFEIRPEPGAPLWWSGLRTQMAAGKRFHLSNCLIAGHTETNGAGVYLYRGDTVIEHCTIVDNNASNSGNGIFVGSTLGRVRIRNSIIRNPLGLSSKEIGGSTTIVTVQGSMIRNGELGASSVDPGVFPGGRINSASAAVGAGVGGFGPAEDFQGQTRDANPDAGFDEWVPLDSDGDGLDDADEITIHLTEPNNPDTDNDDLNDGLEVSTHGTNPLLGDTDGDGESDGIEVMNNTNPLSAISFSIDTDSDQLPDGWEVFHFGSIAPQTGTTDPDQEGLNNLGELAAGTDPNEPDTDGDDLTDKWELDNGYDPLDPTEASTDLDGDGIPDLIEQASTRMNPADPSDGYSDADGDGIPNRYEIELGTDPTDGEDFPAPTIIVDPANGANSSTDNIVSTLGEAMSAIPSTGWPVVRVKAGVYTEKLDFTKRAAVIGEPGSTIPRIAGPGGDYPVYVRAAADGSVLSGFEIRPEAGYQTGWSGLRTLMAAGKTFHLSNCLITGHTESNGAGVYLYRGDTVIEHCTIIGNNATNVGNGIYMANSLGTLKVRNSVVWNVSGSSSKEIGGVTSVVTTSGSMVRFAELGASGTNPGLSTSGLVLLSSAARNFIPTLSPMAKDAFGDTRDQTPDPGFDELIFNDADGDGLSDEDEVNIYGTDPENADSDDDGLTDGDEILTHQTDPNNSDSDYDGLNDGYEVAKGLNPLVAQTPEGFGNPGPTGLRVFTPIPTVLE